MVESMLGLFEAQISWVLSPTGLGILIGGAFLIGSGLLGRIVLFVERELQIRSDRQHGGSSATTTRLSAGASQPAADRRRVA
jgi:hypothetical protein